MFDALIDREDGQIACALEPAMIKHRLQAAKNAYIAIGGGEDAVDSIPEQLRGMSGILRGGDGSGRPALTAGTRSRGTAAAGSAVSWVR